MIKKIFLISFIALCASSQAQNNGATISVFHPGQQTTPKAVTQEHRDSMSHLVKNSLSWNWWLLGRGVFLLNYERYLGSNFSLDIGVGLTYRDFVFELSKGGSIGGDTLQQFSVNNNNESLFNTPGIQLCYEGGLRYYFEGFDNMMGFYLEGMISYRPYNFPNPTFTPVVPANSGFIPGYKFLDEQFKLGYAGPFWLSDFSGEVYIGIGVRNATINTYQERIISSGFPYYNSTTAYVPVTVHEVYPQVLGGFKLSYTF